MPGSAFPCSRVLKSTDFSSKSHSVPCWGRAPHSQAADTHFFRQKMPRKKKKNKRSVKDLCAAQGVTQTGQDSAFSPPQVALDPPRVGSEIPGSFPRDRDGERPGWSSNGKGKGEGTRGIRVKREIKGKILQKGGECIKGNESTTNGKFWGGNLGWLEHGQLLQPREKWIYGSVLSQGWF